MKDNFSDRLLAEIVRKRSTLVAGIDPRPENLPESLSMREFCNETIDAICDIACAIKIQVAFFEQLGPAGWHYLSAVIKYAREKNLIVIVDAKRGDIGSTSEAYASGWFAEQTCTGEDNVIRADALTIAPYLGKDNFDAFEPYIEKGAGAFVLCRTSNKSAVDIQDLKVDREKVWEKVAALVSAWGDPHIGQNGLSSVGAVVGATYPEEGARVREIAPSTWFLVPGIGAQGGKAEDARNFTRDDGTGAIFNVSRGIMYAYLTKEYAHLGEKHFAEAVRASAESYRRMLWEACRMKV